MGDFHVPKGYKHAHISPQAECWRIAIAKEISGLIAVNTWSYVRTSDLPTGSNIMSCHYIFTVKYKADGFIYKFKARLVVDGNTQKCGIDYDRIFVTVVKPLNIRFFLIAAARDYNLSSLDIRQAYLQAEIKEDLFMHVPLDVSHHTSAGKPRVCKLR